MDNVSTVMVPKGTAAGAKSDISGTSLGDFHLQRCLGQGGMGQVYLAEQRSLKRKVAVKVMRAELSANETAVKRFRAEAEAVARLTHPNIVQIYAIDEQQGITFIALEFVDGVGLNSYMAKKGPLPIQLVLSITRQVAAALHHAGEQGIVHRDIKPENILITRKGEVKVTDFGLARCTGGDDQQALNLTQSGVILGTPMYMSPEQVQGKKADRRTDIYSLGVTCYHMLAGRPPYKGNSAFDLAYQHVQGTAPPLGEARGDLSTELCSLVAKMMAKEPKDRFQSGQELIKELAGLRDGAGGGKELRITHFDLADEAAKPAANDSNLPETIALGGPRATPAATEIAVKKTGKAKRKKKAAAAGMLAGSTMKLVVALGLCAIILAAGAVAVFKLSGKSSSATSAQESPGQNEPQPATAHQSPPTQPATTALGPSGNQATIPPVSHEREEPVKKAFGTVVKGKIGHIISAAFTKENDALIVEAMVDGVHKTISVPLSPQTFDELNKKGANFIVEDTAGGHFPLSDIRSSPPPSPHVKQDPSPAEKQEEERLKKEIARTSNVRMGEFAKTNDGMQARIALGLLYLNNNRLDEADKFFKETTDSRVPPFKAIGQVGQALVLSSRGQARESNELFRTVNDSNQPGMRGMAPRQILYHPQLQPLILAALDKNAAAEPPPPNDLHELRKSLIPPQNPGNPAPQNPGKPQPNFQNPNPAPPNGQPGNPNPPQQGQPLRPIFQPKK